MKIVVLASVVFLALLSCRKDPTIPAAIPPTCPGPMPNSPPLITIGDTTGMLVFSYDSTLSVGFQIPDSAIFPLWCDSSMGVSISAVSSGSLGMGYTSHSEISGFGGLEILMNEKTDTIFTYVSDYFNNSPPPPALVGHYVITTRTCSPAVSNASVYEILDELQLFTDGQNISLANNTYKSDFAHLFQESKFTHLPGSMALNNDTLFITGISNDRTCSNLPGDSAVYLGIRAEIEGIDKLGWIKLRRVSTGAQITLLETAIQK